VEHQSGGDEVVDLACPPVLLRYVLDGFLEHPPGQRERLKQRFANPSTGSFAHYDTEYELPVSGIRVEDEEGYGGGLAF